MLQSRLYAYRRWGFPFRLNRWIIDASLNSWGMASFLDIMWNNSVIFFATGVPPALKISAGETVWYHCGISLLSIAGKVLARVLLNRLNEHLEQAGLLPESQCRFRKDKGTIGIIFTVSREMPGTEHGHLHDLCWLYQSILYSQSWGSLENYGEVWLSDQVHSNSEAVPRWYTLKNYGEVWLSDQVHCICEAVPRWYACTGPKRWWVFWSIPCDKWCQARLY